MAVGGSCRRAICLSVGLSHLDSLAFVSVYYIQRLCWPRRFSSRRRGVCRRSSHSPTPARFVVAHLYPSACRAAVLLYFLVYRRDFPRWIIMRQASNNCVQATPGYAFCLFLSQCPGAS